MTLLLLRWALAAAAAAGSLSAPDDQTPADAAEWARLLDPDATAAALAEASVVRDADGAPRVEAITESQGNPKVRFRMTVQAPDGSAFRVLFKPRQRHYRDWSGEVICFRLGRALGVRLTPVAERTFRRDELGAAVEGLPAGHARLLSWEGDGDQARLRGAAIYWVEAYRPRVGRYPNTPEGLLELADRLEGATLPDGPERRLLADLAGVLLLDFLVFNEDRHNNLGSARAPEGNDLLLVPIDFGDTLNAPASHDWMSRRRLWAATAFPREPADRLRALEPEALRGLLDAAPDGEAAATEVADAVVERRERFLERLEGLVERRGEAAVYF